MGLTVLKGHGTENDFVVVPDPDAAHDLHADAVVALCNRHAGIGADGVLRVVPTKAVLEVAEFADVAPWFMDYRNADGSIAEMCGNGVRVFARYLVEAGLVDASEPLQVATRGGVASVAFEVDGRISVDMGVPARRAESPRVRVPVQDSGGFLEFAGQAWDLPNPHVVCETGGAQLAALDLTRPPAVDPALPHGQNVEFVVREADRTVRMRVHERGSGETRSCGTGICAVVAALSGDDRTGTWTVHVPGGTCTVAWTDDGRLVLTGPAVIVAQIELSEAWTASGGPV
ncbi:diaminopimelate epimerase [Jatrophihabitans sp. YIM 134969]